jgi:type IV pilus assembly protein PilV
MLTRYRPQRSARALIEAGTPADLRGFSLIEVMVALVVLSIGLLGVAKLETVALSSTTVASQRSMAAIEAASLAATMHLNRGYWAGRDPSTPSDTIGAVVTVTGAPPSTTTITATTNATILSTSLGKTPNCYSTTYPAAPSNSLCPAVADLAAYDLQKWAAEVQSVLPNYSATISCGSGTPLACEINITWNENAVAVNAQEASVTTAMQSPSYTLYVQP